MAIQPFGLQIVPLRACRDCGKELALHLQQDCGAQKGRFPVSDSDLALRRFDTVSRYYAYETTMYWARSHFFLVANTGLLALTVTRLSEPDVVHPYLLAAACCFGGILSVLWYLTLLSGQYWTNRWEAICSSATKFSSPESVSVRRNRSPFPNRQPPDHKRRSTNRLS